MAGNYIIDLIREDGERTACSAGIYEYHCKAARNWERKHSMQYVFGVHHKWFTNRSNPHSPEEADYHLWREHLEKIFNLEIVGDKWRTPVWSYGQLVFLATLIRQPVEYYKTYPFVFKYMVDNKVDPMATIVGLARKDGGGDGPQNYWRQDSGWFYNSYGHGLAYITDILRGEHNLVPLEKLRTLDAVKGMNEMEGEGAGIGSMWQRRQYKGQLAQPREYEIGNGSVTLPIVPEVVEPPKPKPVKPRMLRVYRRDAKGRFAKDLGAMLQRAVWVGNY